MNPPKVGSIITYRFQELTLDGVPRLVVSERYSSGRLIRLQFRFPSFVGEAIDKDEPKDAEIPAKNQAKPEASPGDKI